MGRMDGRVAFITGAARGQGRSHALRLAEEGADIVGIDICAQIDEVPYAMATPEDLEETVVLVEKTGRRMIGTQCDVRDLPGVKAAFDAGVAEFGHIDTVIANAGIIMSNPDEVDAVAAWHIGIDVMLTGVWNVLHTAAPHLIEQKRGGAIVCTSSAAGIMNLGDGSGGNDAYGVAKTAVIGLAKTYAVYLGPHEVRVNSIAPTGVNTPMVNANPALFKMIEANPTMVNAMMNILPSLPILEASDISETVLHLVANDSGRAITGINVPIDAGLLIRK